MCGRYGRDLPWSVIQEAMNLIPARATPNMAPEWDIRPTTQQWVARPAEGGMELTRMRWGLIPFFHSGKPLKAWKATCFNARAETVATSPAFRESFKRRRCLVPASCWYEWTGAKGDKTKYRFTSRHEPWLVFAGLWDRCTTADEGEVQSFTIVTQPAGSPLNTYHDRAPVVLERSAWSTWLDPDADATPLLGPEIVDAFEIERADA